MLQDYPAASVLRLERPTEIQEAAMTTQQDISTHYTHGNLIATIRSGIESLGKTVNSVAVDLAPVDEFHTGGRQASEHFLGRLDLTPEKHILDVGCGLGGPARFAASRYQCPVDGIDLTPEYIETGRVLCGWVGLSDRISLHQGSVLSMPFADGVFDGAYMLHVGMNIEKSQALLGGQSRSAAGRVFRDIRCHEDRRGRAQLSRTVGDNGCVKRRNGTGAIPQRAAGGRFCGDCRTQPTRLRARVH